MKKFVFLAFFGILFAMQPFEIRSEDYFNQVKIAKLNNGLTLVVAPYNLAPVVKQTIIYKVGAIDEPSGQSGIAHLLEHLMFKGTKKYPDGKFSQSVSLMGGSENASTNRDSTRYYQIVPKKYLPQIMQMEADRMRGLVLDDKIIAPEKQVVISERLQRIDAEPTAKLVEKISAALYPNHPYRLPLIGFEHEIAAITAKQALDFYNRFYHPNNAILVISGNVDFKQALALAKKYYGKIPAHKASANPIAQDPSLLGESLIQYHHPNIANSNIILARQAPSVQSLRQNNHALIGDIMEVFLNQRTSLLYKNLVQDKKIATGGVSFQYNGDARGQGMMLIYLQAKPNADFAYIQGELRQTMQEIAQKGISETELNDIKTAIKDRFLLSLDDFNGLSNYIANYLALGLSLDEIKAIPSRIDAINAQEINDFMRQYFANHQGEVWGFQRKLTQ